MKEKIYTVKEAAKLLGYSTNTVYSYLKSGELKSVRVGKGKIRIPASEIERFAPSPNEDVAEETPEVVVGPLVLAPPRPGRSLADISSESPWHIIKLWLEERVGLPKLFDWLVALASIVLGMSMFLYNRQLDLFIAGNLTDWFLPIRLTLIIAGFGLILADMIQEEFSVYKHINNIFRTILVIVYFVLAYLQMKTGDMDGLIINGLFGVTILIEAVFGVLSSTAYMFYISSLVVGILLAFRYFPSTTGLSSISAVVYRYIDGYSWILLVFVISVIFSVVWGYFTGRKILKIILCLCGVSLIALSAHYASESYWARSFFVLITAMIGMLLPFWERFKNRIDSDRTLVFKMFGSILMTFSMAVVLIGVVQSILTNEAMVSLSDKADYGKLLVDNAVDSSLSALEGLSENSLFREALKKNRRADLESFMKASFKNNLEFSSVAVVNIGGSPVAVYPFMDESIEVDFRGLSYFGDVARGELRHFSSRAEEYPYSDEETVVVGVPVRESNGDVIGAVFAAYNMNVLADRLQEMADDLQGQYFGVLDVDGRWLMNKNESLLGSKVAETDTTYLAWLGSKRLILGYNGFGRYSIVALSQSKNIGWTITIAQPMYAILDVSKSGLVMVMFMLFVTALVVAYSYVSTNEKEELL